MDPELKKALDALGMTFDQAVEAQNKAITAFRTESEANDKKRDSVNDEKLAKITAELDKFEKLNEVVTRIEAKAKEDEESAKERQEQMDRIEARLNRPTGANGEQTDEAAKEYHDCFMAWSRKDQAAFGGDRKNVLQVSDETSAGVLASPEFVKSILKGIVEVSPMRGLVTVRTTGSRSVLLPKRTSRPAATWVGEVEERVESTPNLGYGMDDIPVHEANLEIIVSLQQLEDSDFNLEDEFREAAQDGFGEQEGVALISGNAFKKPQGILNGSGYVRVASGLATDIAADNLIDLKHAIKTGYAKNGSFILNRPTLGKVRKMKDGNGQYLWAPGLAAGKPNTIDGEFYAEMADMPSVGAGFKPVAFGDWKKAYTLVDRVQMTVMRDPYSLSSQGKVKFNWRRRLGGMVRLGEAYAVLEVAAS